MLRIMGFQGEIPRLYPRLLPPTHAQSALNTKLENGALIPFRKPRLDDTLGASSKTIYKYGATWLDWDSWDVDAVPGPVSTDRLYITGDGAPKLLVDGTDEYPLALDPPAAKPTVRMRVNREYITVDGKEVRLSHNVTGTSSTLGVSIEVSVRASTATVTITSEAGITAAQAQTLVNNLKYRNAASSTNIIPSLKIVRLTRIQDNGGQDYDDNRNPIGSDTRVLEDVGTTVNVASSTLTYTFETPATLDSTNVSGQNDPPTLTTTGLAPSYAASDPAVSMFSSTSISTIEGSQNIILLEVVIEGLTNGTVDPSLQETVLYAYTFVTEFDEESQPSPLSQQILWSPGQSLRIDTFSSAPSGRGIDRMRIYRSQTSALGQTDLYFVAEIDIADTRYDDVLDTTPTQEPIPSISYTPPPDALEGIISMPNGMMAAFVGRSLYFSEPWRPHAWPAKYVLEVDAPIVGLVSFGSHIAILTTKHPYVAQGSHPATMVMEKLEVNLPCISARSVVDMGFYGAYASTEGLVTIDAGGARLVTQDLFTPYEWQDLDAASFRAAQHQGRYILSYDDDASTRRCVIIDLTGASPFVTRTTDRPRSFFFDVASGDLYYLHTNATDIYQFDSQTGGYATQRWRSKPFHLAQPTSFPACLIEGENLQRKPTLAVKLIADGRRIDTINDLNRIARIHGGRTARVWEIEVVGTTLVSSVTLGTPEEIASLANG